MQLAFRLADERLTNAVSAEYEARLWNFTDDFGEDALIPEYLDPSCANDSPEMSDPKGFDAGLTVAESFMLTPVLWTALSKYSDPKTRQLTENNDIGEGSITERSYTVESESSHLQNINKNMIGRDIEETKSEAVSVDDLLIRLQSMREKTEEMLADIKKDITSNHP